MKISAIKAILDTKKNPFVTNSRDARIEIKAEISSFNMRWYMNLIKLRVRLRVATIKKASCARLRVRSYVELRSCGCGNSKLVASHALDYNK